MDKKTRKLCTPLEMWNSGPSMLHCQFSLSQSESVELKVYWDLFQTCESHRVASPLKCFMKMKTEGGNDLDSCYPAVHPQWMISPENQDKKNRKQKKIRKEKKIPITVVNLVLPRRSVHNDSQRRTYHTITLVTYQKRKIRNLLDNH